MSLTVVKRPQDFYLSTTENADKSVFNSSGALINNVGHGLSTGYYVYITEGPSQMLGFWYVEILDADNFYIREYATASRVQSYVTSDTATYYQAFLTQYPFLSVHNPIVYKLTSDLWPVNGVDTARSVSSFANLNGYTALSLSGTLHTGSTALEKVVIDGTASLDGVYTIIQWISPSSIVIDLSYSASNSFSGGTVEYYYYNYHARIRIYSGLSPTWTSQIDKPIELLAELRCIPNPSGVITINVSEIVKEKISILTNDTAKQALPDFYEGYTAIYIEYAESYDDSNGYTVEEFVSSYTTDGTTIFATNGKLPFKNRNFGFAQYININSTTFKAKWMTNFDEPVLTPGKYFDLGIIFTSTPTHIQKTVYVDDVAMQVYTTAISGLAFGMQRFPVEQSGWSEDRIDVVILNGSDEVSETITINVDNDCSDQDFYTTWLTPFGVFDYWNFKARKTYNINVEGSRVQEKNIFQDWPASGGEFADTMRQQTSRESRNTVRIESQHLTLEELSGIKWIISSPLVQIVTSKYDRRTVLVDGSSVRLYQDKDKLFNIGFTISYTDKLPSQSL